MECPKCGGEMWDNRGRKKNPRAPDFKCKDKEGCDGVIWPEKNAPAKSAPPNGQRHGDPKWTWLSLYRTYGRCWKLAESVMIDSSKRTKIAFSTADLHAAAATIFIAAANGGVAPDAPKPEPVTAAQLSERPVALDKGEDDDLPF